MYMYIYLNIEQDDLVDQNELAEWEARVSNINITRLSILRSELNNSFN